MVVLNTFYLLNKVGTLLSYISYYITESIIILNGNLTIWIVFPVDFITGSWNAKNSEEDTNSWEFYVIYILHILE